MTALPPLCSEAEKIVAKSITSRTPVSLASAPGGTAEAKLTRRVDDSLGKAGSFVLKELPVRPERQSDAQCRADLAGARLNAEMLDSLSPR